MLNLYEQLRDSLPGGHHDIGGDDRVKSVVLAPFVNLDGREHLLFEKRAPHIRQGDEICFPGGRADPADGGESRITAERETMEELGLPREKITVDAPAGSLYSAMGTVVELFVGRLNIGSLEELSPNPDEVAKIVTVPFQWFIDNPPREYQLDLQVHPYRTDPEGNRVDIFPARKLGLPERYWETWKTRRSPTYVYQIQGEVLWGITAVMVRHLVRFLEAR